MRLFSLLLLTLPLVAGADMTITASEQVSQKISPDVLRGVLRYEERSRSADTIKNELNVIIAAVRRLDPKAEHCRGGGYHLSPRYSYKDQTQVFEGYTGVLSFECTFGAIEPYNALTAAVDKVSGPGIKKTQGALGWVVSDKRREALKEELRGRVIMKAAVQAKQFSALTASECTVSSVTFEQASRPAPIGLRSNAVMAEASAPTESPLPAEEEITAGASVIYSCRELARAKRP